MTFNKFYNAIYLLMFVVSKAFATSENPNIKNIENIAINSACARYGWPEYGSSNRTSAPRGYIVGVAKTFARSLCRLKQRQSVAVAMSRANTGNTSSDALAHYQSIFDRLSMDIRNSETETLKSLYTLGFGLGMMESSGCYYEGWDLDAGSNRSSEEAEAGLYQTSFNIVRASPEIRKIYDEYLSGKKSCLTDDYKAEVSCAKRGLLGKEAAGLEFQRIIKSCPALATELAVLSLRYERRHYYPINTRTAEVAPVCHDLLSNVESYVNSHESEICNE